MAEAVSGDDPQQPSADEEAVLVARRRAVRTLPRHRFGLAYLGLAALLGAAVGLFVVLVANGGRSSGPAWSAWKPRDVGVKGRDEIAQHVSTHYSLAGGRRLVGVYSTPPVVSLQGQLALARWVFVATGLPGETSADGQPLDAGTIWTYQLCGLGKNCTIATGTPSVRRGQVLQREALELSLYTFKYDSSIDHVAVYFPPTSGSQALVVLLHRSDLAQPLSQPLAATLPPSKKPLTPATLRTGDFAAIHRYISAAYSYASETTQDGSPLLRLTPAPG